MGLRVLEMRTLVLLLVLFLRAHCGKAGVSYDHKSLVVDGNRRILISGSIHYPRSTPNMWPDLIDKAKQGGLDVIETYVFWNGHEPQQGKYYFEDRYDLVKFIKLVQKAGMYVILRIGPYVCAEWNFGGFPVWLRYVPDIKFRTDNEPFKDAMEKFTKKIVSMMKDESLFQSQGGPVILSQIENEYDAMEYEVGAPGKRYAQWAAKMAVGLNTGVPWIMCKQRDAPSPVINTCNGFYCHSFKPNDDSKPMIWTEAWSGWFNSFGGPVSHRPAEDLAFAVALFFQNGGALMNYYMYHGGTNFGRTSGGPFITTSYDYDAPIDEYGLIRQPKWGHLKNLHKAIKQCEKALVSGDPIVTKLGVKNQEAHVFDKGNGVCAAFLTNYDQHSTVTVTFRGVSYSLPRWSVSILPDCKNVVYNTAEISDQSTSVEMTTVAKGFKWKSYSEVATSEGKGSFTKNVLLEQLSTTWDKSDYLWYSTEVKIDSSERFLQNGSNPVLTVSSSGDVLYVFINGEFSGTAHGIVDHPKFVFRQEVKMKVGVNSISLLSVGVGLPNIGRFFEQRLHGVYGVTLEGLDGGKRDLANQKWTYKVGIYGESSSLHTRSGTSSVSWFKEKKLAAKTPLTWYKASFKQPSGNEPLALNMESMGKGQVWINGQNIGRYWTEKASGDCAPCDYAGWYHENKCSTGCGEPSQKWYHVPRSWLNRTRNLVVVFEEKGGDPSGIALAKRHVGSSG